MAERYAVVIAGGGPVGAALALGLRESGHSIALLEARPPDTALADARVIALSHGSRLIMERLGVWDTLPRVTPILNITVSQQRHFGRVHLTAAQAQVPALGYVVDYAALQRAMIGGLTGSAVDVLTGCRAQSFSGDANGAALSVECGGTTRELESRLVALADGGDGVHGAHIEERDYGQCALVCDVVSAEPHHNRAFERFTADGPLALLPTARGWSLVWTVPSARAHELAALDEAQFCAKLHTAFGFSLGTFHHASERHVFALKLKHAQRPLASRIVLVGNAAQSLHPVAGQGFNLGLRDAWELATALRAAHDPGDPATVNAYFKERRFDRTATILFTDTLIRLFSNDIPILDTLCSAGLTALNGIAPAKNFLVRRMLFGVRG